MTREWFHKRTPREKVFALLTGGVLLVASIRFGIGSFLFPNIGELNQDISRLELQSLKNQKLFAMEKSLQPLEERIRKVHKINLSNQQIENQLQKIIERLARRSKAHITLLKPLPMQEEITFKKFFVAVELEANMRALVRFLHALKLNTTSLKVETLHIRQQGKNSSLLKIHLVLLKIL